MARGKKSVAVNLKRLEGTEIVRKMCQKADVLIEPFRPGDYMTKTCHAIYSDVMKISFKKF